MHWDSLVVGGAWSVQVKQNRENCLPCTVAANDTSILRC